MNSPRDLDWRFKDCGIRTGFVVLLDGLWAGGHGGISLRSLGSEKTYWRELL